MEFLSSIITFLHIDLADVFSVLFCFLEKIVAFRIPEGLKVFPENVRSQANPLWRVLYKLILNMNCSMLNNVLH